MLLKMFFFIFSLFLFLFSQDADVNPADTDSAKEQSESGFNEDIIDFNYLSKKDSFNTGEETEEIIKRSFFIDNWIATLNEGARFPINKRFSYTKKAVVDKSKLDQNFATLVDENVLGIRIMFPKNKSTAFANVSQRFKVNPFFYKQREEDFKRGFLENVGEIKSISVVVKGKGYPVNLYVVMRDQDYNQIKINMGSLKFYGWKVLQWKNQDYIQDAKDRLDSKEYPLYPAEMPYLIFENLVFERPNVSRGEKVVTDFVSYVSKIRISYDKAIILPEQDDIDDEATWGIDKNRVQVARRVTLGQYSKIERFEKLEKERMNLSDSGDNSNGGQQESSQDQQVSIDENEEQQQDQDESEQQQQTPDPQSVEEDEDF